MNRKLTLFKVIDAPATKVWSYLVEPAGLTQWLADDAAVDLRPGGSLRIHSSTPLLSARYEITSYEINRHLSLRWILNQWEMNATWRIEEVEGGVKVKVEFQAPAKYSRDEALNGSDGSPLRYFYQVWYYALDLLKSSIDFGKAECRLAPDENPTEIAWSMEVRVPPAELFRSLTDPNKIPDWNLYAGDRVLVEPREGGRYSWGWPSESTRRDGPNQIVQYEKDKLLSYTWFSQPYAPTLVTWKLEPTSSGSTLIHFRQTGFDRPSVALNEWKFSWTGFLYFLKYFFEQKRPLEEIGGCY